MSYEKLTAEELHEQYNKGIRIFKFKDISNESFQKFHLPGIHFTGMSMEDANFTDTNLEGSRIMDCGLEGTIFNRANLKHSEIYGLGYYIDLSNSDLRYSYFGDMWLIGANLTKTNLSYCKARDTWFENCYFEKTVLNYANFIDAYMLGDCIFKNVDFEGCLFRYYDNFNYIEVGTNTKYYSVPNIPENKLAKAYILKPYSNLSHADFSQIPGVIQSLDFGYLGDIDLSHADLSHANLSRVNLSHVDLDKFNLAKALPMYFPNLNLSYANLKHSILIKLRIHRGNLQQAQLDFCQVIATSIKDTDFSGSSLRYASFKNSHLRNVSFRDCQFEHTDFTNTYIYGDAQIPPEVDLSQAHLLPADAPYPDPLFG